MSSSRLEDWYAECERDSVDSRDSLPVPRRTPTSPAERRQRAERLACVSTPSEADIAWLTAALGNERRKWFVARVADEARALPESLLVPMLDAAINEINPSYNRNWVTPCVRAFGSRRVQTYLLEVLRTGTDFQKAGAANALLWAIERTDDERISLADVRQARRAQLLETFVTSSNIDVQRSTYRWLSFEPSDYPPTERPLVERAIAIARNHQDPYIKHGVEQRDRRKAGKIGTSRAIPYRKRQA